MAGNRVALILVLALLAGRSEAAFAQETIDEVLVTAQKRTQDAKDVPVAISVLDASELAGLEMRDSLEIVNHVPGMMLGGTLGKTKPQIFLRGVGSSDFQSGSTSPVAIYIDQVYQGSNFGVTSLLMDLERVEVLKGPQGTLWGRNTTGGLINFVPRKADPRDPLNGYASLSYGRFGDVNVGAALGVPVSKNFASRFAVSYGAQDGVFDAVGPAMTDDGFGGWDWLAARANFFWTPNDRLDVSTSVSFSDMNGSLRPAKSLGIRGAGCQNPGFPGTTCSDNLGFVSDPDLHVVAPTNPTFEDTENFSVDVQLAHDIGDGASFTSITAFSTAERQAFDDSDGSPSPLLNISYEDEYEGWSQELRLASDFRKPLSGVAGVYYYTDELIFYRTSQIPLFGTSGTLRSQVSETETAAIFGEGTYRPSERVELTAGLRWTYDNRVGSVRSGTNRAITGQFVSRDFALANIINLQQAVDGLEESWEELSGRVSLVYRMTDATNLWGTLARGFKGGDPNSGAVAPGSYNISEPEYVSSLEVGVKTRSQSGALAASASAFYYKYDDKQVFTEISNPGTGNVIVLGNAGQLTIKGLDAEVMWSATERMHLQMGLSYTDAVFDEFLSPGSGADLSGNEPPYTPELKFDVIGRYVLPLRNGGSLGIQADAVYNDDYFFTNENVPQLTQKAYWLVGGNIGYTAPEDRWDARLWVKNAFDEEYLVGGFDFTFLGPFLVYPGDPRIYGASVTVRF